MPVTIRDVAREVGCSITTVSYVINDGPRGVRPETRERILEAMKRLNYHPSAVARSLNRKHLDTIGVVFPQPEATLTVNPFFGAVLDGIIKTAARERQNVTLYTGLEWKSGRESLAAFRDGRSDGLLLLSPRTNTDLVDTLREAGISFVLVCSSGERNAAVTSVDIDNAAAARQAVEHLLRRGHQRIAYLGGEPGAPSAPYRRRGYEEALAAANIARDDALTLEDVYRRSWDEAGARGALGLHDETWGYEGTQRLLALSRRPTALFAANDMIAGGAYRACREAGVQIPDDLSIVGFDDTIIALHLTPPLTTVRQPMSDLGATAGGLLLEMLRAEASGEPAPPARHVTLPTYLVERGSTKFLQTP